MPNNKKPGGRPGSLHSTERDESTAAAAANPTPTPENMRPFLVGFFVERLDVLLRRLTATELQIYLRFRVEYVYAGAGGLVDDDDALSRDLKCKSWSTVKAKLQTLGCIYSEAGRLRDHELDGSIDRQRKTSARQRANANKRWSVAKIGGAA